MSGFDFTDKVMLVTGGAGGLGSAMCRRFAFGGARCIVVDIDGRRAEKVAAELPGAGHTGIGCDLTDRGQVERLFAMVADTYGRLDVLVNNVGMTSAERFDVRSIESIEQEIGLNLTSPLIATRIAIPLLKASQDARVVTTVSSVGSSRSARPRSTPLPSSGCGARCSPSGLTCGARAFWPGRCFRRRPTPGCCDRRPWTAGTPCSSRIRRSSPPTSSRRW